MRLFQLLLVCIFILNTLFSCSTKSDKEQEKELAQSMLPKDGLNSGDSSSFEKEFVAQFRAGSLPYETSNDYSMEDTIPAMYVVENIFEAAEEAGLNVFREFWGDEELKKITRKGLEDRYIQVENDAFAVLNFGFLHRVNLHPNFYSLVFQCIPTFMEGSYSYIYLANYTYDGKLIDALRIGGLAGYVDMQNQWKGIIKEDQTLEVKGKSIRKADAFGKAEDYIETSHLVYSIGDDGKIIAKDQRFSSFTGSFQSDNSDEILKIEEFFDEIFVSYSPESFTAQEENLEVIEVDKEKRQIITQFPNTAHRLVLEYDEDNVSFVCKNSEGKTQKFKRQDY